MDLKCYISKLKINKSVNTKLIYLIKLHKILKNGNDFKLINRVIFFNNYVESDLFWWPGWPSVLFPGERKSVSNWKLSIYSSVRNVLFIVFNSIMK